MKALAVVLLRGKAAIGFPTEVEFCFIDEIY